MRALWSSFMSGSKAGLHGRPARPRTPAALRSMPGTLHMAAKCSTRGGELQAPAEFAPNGRPWRKASLQPPLTQSCYFPKTQPLGSATVSARFGKFSAISTSKDDHGLHPCPEPRPVQMTQPA